MKLIKDILSERKCLQKIPYYRSKSEGIPVSTP